MEFKEFVEYADEINGISSNIKIVDEISKLISDSNEEDVSIVPRFVQGRIFPLHDSRNIGISTSSIRTSISKSTGIDEEELKSNITDVSDMGELFDLYNIIDSGGQQTLGSSSLGVKDVYQTLEEISETSGKGSRSKKNDLLSNLYASCSSKEAKYLTRLVNGNLSIGVGEGSVRKSIAKEYDLDESLVERAIMLTNDTGEVSRIANEYGINGLKNISVRVGDAPLRPMKAKKSEVKSVFEDMDEDFVYGEYKYDGFRIQIHIDNGEVSLYTNKLEDVTDSLPDVVNMIEENIESEQAILDGEIVGYESNEFEEPLEYRKTQKRIRRKHNIQEIIEEIPVKPKIFDILYDSEDGLLIDNSLFYRYEKLKDICPDKIRVEHRKCNNVKNFQDLISDAESDGHEGGMAKDPTSGYEPNNRGTNWLKLKPSGETIDAVVIGGTYGDGKRSDDIASYELAIWNQDKNRLESVGDVGTGFTDKEFDEITNTLEDEIISQDGRSVNINPEMVFEVEFEEVQDSPKYESGYGLRFPRFIRRRPDKSVDDADTVKRLESISKNL